MKNADSFVLASSFNFRWKTWSGRRDSNPRLQPWQGCALPLSYARIKYDYLVELQKYKRKKCYLNIFLVTELASNINEISELFFL